MHNNLFLHVSLEDKRHKTWTLKLERHKNTAFFFPIWQTGSFTSMIMTRKIVSSLRLSSLLLRAFADFWRLSEFLEAVSHGIASADYSYRFWALNPTAFTPVLSGTSFYGQLAVKSYFTHLTPFFLFCQPFLTKIPKTFQFPGDLFFFSLKSP